MGRRTLAALLVAVILTCCGKGSGVHTQALPPDSSATSVSALPTPSTDPSTPGASLSTVPTPTVTAPAQDAVTAYLSFYRLSTAADKDPSNADIAQLDSYLTGKARTLYDGVYAGMKASGLAYRGTPDTPRLAVGTILSPSFLFLTSCPAPSINDPFIQYTVSTGTAVPVKAPAVAPPWKRTISMQKVGSDWKVADILVDTSKTCSS